MVIILDAMGSDKRPDPEIQGAVDAAAALDVEIILVGDEAVLAPKLAAANPNHLPVRIHHAPEAIEMGDHAVESAKAKPGNSMAVGVDLLKRGEGQAFVTAGATGAAMFISLLSLKRIPGIQRPALTAIFPTRTGRCVVLDIGANADCRPEFFPQFAIMGSLYAERVLGVKNPRVGLLANGEEEGKGNELVKSSFPLVKASGVNFIGNTEPKELFGGSADVVITDGFTGNIMLKSSEAVARLITDTLKTELTASFTRKIGALLVKPAFKKVKSLVDPTDVGAAPLLGVNGLVFVGHGRSDAKSITSAIRVAKQAVDAGLMDAMRDALKDRVN